MRKDLINRFEEDWFMIKNVIAKIFIEK